MSERIIEFGQHDNMALLSWIPNTTLREEIVRCRDCKHYMACGSCFLPDGFGDFKRWAMPPDGFCSEGERRDAK